MKRVLYLLLKLRYANGHKELFCKFLLEKCEIRGKDGLCHISWYIRLPNVVAPIQRSENKSVDRKGGY
jgi:hypothetical protein